MTLFLIAVFSIPPFIVVGLSHWRYTRRLAREVRALMAAARMNGHHVTADLPPSVERYRRLAVGTRSPVRNVHLRHSGTFCTRATATPRAIRGEQWFTSDPPGFVWSARVRIVPGLWARWRDMIVVGKAGMRVLIEDTIAVTDGRGARFDDGYALRLLAEMVWYPTALFDTRSVTWSTIDATRASATLRLDGCSVTGVFELGADGLPLQMTAERLDIYGELRSWVCTYRDWRAVDGMCVPFEAEFAWNTTPPFVYAHWQVASIDYDLEQVTPSRWADRALALELILGLGAIGGGSALMIAPNGEIIPLPVVALAGSPFANYFIPGAILFAVLGVVPLVAAILTLRRNRFAPWFALAIGGALMAWIGVEISIVGYSNHPPLQLAYLVLGVVTALVGIAWLHEKSGPSDFDPIVNGTS